MENIDYLKYLRNTGFTATSAQFDEDWDPIGPMVRDDLAGLIEEVEGGLLTLTVAGRELLDQAAE